jgi:hypothetical protein
MDSAEPISLPDPPHPIPKALAEAIAEAQTLLRYAAQEGIKVDAATMRALVHADSCVRGGAIADAATVDFYTAATALAAQVHPVTARSLRCSQSGNGAGIIRTAALSAVLALGVVIFSGVSFLTGSMSADIQTAIAKADALAVTLRSQVGSGEAAPGPASAAICAQPTARPQPDIPFTDTATLIRELQEFAATDRELLRTGAKLNFFVHDWETSPLDKVDEAKPDSHPWLADGAHRMELDPGLLDMRRETFCQIATYQDVRSFAQNVRNDSLAIYGAMSGYALPVLYALLGAFAYTLRDYNDRMKRQTFLKSRQGNMARTIAALTAGAIISLFNNFSQGTPLQPLAVAFLVGYGVEIFYAFLDTLLTTFVKRWRDDAAPANK